jgi:hypothetical protein
MRKRDLFILPLGNYILTDGIYKFMLQKKLKDWGDKSVYYSIREYGSLFGGSVNLYEKMDNVFEDSYLYKQKVLSFVVFITGMSFAGDNDCYMQLSRLRFVPKSSYKEWLNKVEVNIKKAEINEPCNI